MKIRFTRQWSCSPRGEPEQVFEAGDYEVPSEISPYLADRALRSGRAHRVDDKEATSLKSPARRARRAPENKVAVD